jgi:ribonucleoside-diphosphate reductase subunit M1
MLKVFNDTARHINQSGKRNGSFAFYLKPWHTDIMDYLEAKKKSWR